MENGSATGRAAMVVNARTCVSSGFIGIATQEAILQPQAPPDVTRFRVTFTKPGTFKYYCILHDNLGMSGTVIVY